jgi:lipid-binding SYLF domain-containing protein
MNRTRRSLLIATVTMVATVAMIGRSARANAAPAASARGVDQNADQALQALYAIQPQARELAGRAKGILVFPNVRNKEMIMYDGTERAHVLTSRGDGALRVGGRTAGYYNIVAHSEHCLDNAWSLLEAWPHTFSYALFFMTDSALKYLTSSNGWSIVSGPPVAVADKGAAVSMTSTRLAQDVYALPFNQQGRLMAGIGFKWYPTRIVIHHGCTDTDERYHWNLCRTISRIEPSNTSLIGTI